MTKWVLVPEEPTGEMIDAGIGTFDKDFKAWDSVDISKCYQVMLASTPAPPPSELSERENELLDAAKYLLDVFEQSESGFPPNIEIRFSARDEMKSIIASYESGGKEK